MKLFNVVIILYLFFCSLFCYPVYSQPEQGVCARVRIQIVQDAVLTRNGFEAKLEMDNNTENSVLEEISFELSIIDEDGNDANEKFSIQVPTVEQFEIADGQTQLNPGITGKVSWILIPTDEAAPDGPVSYNVAGMVNYTLDGQQVRYPLAPDEIQVFPDPRLRIDYFHERDVFSDDPFTDEIEPPVPFNLGVMVHNFGRGTAQDMSITSAQPKIIENEKGLLVDFKIISTQVGLDEVSPSLTARFGDIEPGETAVANWAMTSTLQGEFIEYEATFEHTSALGEENVSLIDSLNIHEMIHTVRIDQPEDDGLPDYLVNDLGDDELPEQIYTSQGFQVPVSTVFEAEVSGAPIDETNVTAQVQANLPTGWVYLRFDNPAGKEFDLAKVVRDDGHEPIMDYNVWTTYRIRRLIGQAPFAENYVHLVDYNSSGNYTLTYTQPDEQPTPIPSPTLRVIEIPAPNFSTPTPTPPETTPTPTVTPTPVSNLQPEPIFVQSFQPSNTGTPDDLFVVNDMVQVNGTFVGLEDADVNVVQDAELDESVLSIELNPTDENDSGTFVLFRETSPLVLEKKGIVRATVKTDDPTAQIYVGLIDTNEMGDLLEENDFGKSVGSTLGMDNLVVSPSLLGEWGTVVAMHQSETGYVKPFVQVVGNQADSKAYFHDVEVYALDETQQYDSSFFGMDTAVNNLNRAPDYRNLFNNVSGQDIAANLTLNDIFSIRGTLANLDPARVEIGNDRFWEGNSLRFEMVPVDGQASGTLVILSQEQPIPVEDKALARVYVRSSDPSNQIYFGLIDTDANGNLVGTLGMDSLLSTTNFVDEWGVLTTIHKSNTGYVRPFLQVANDLENSVVWFDQLEVFVIQPGDVFEGLGSVQP